jgi:hypothetical protein
MAAAVNAVETPALRMPKRKEDICQLRWEIEHKVTKKRRRPLTQAEITYKEAQIEAFEKKRVAAGGKPFRALNKKIEAIPEKTADAVVARLTSLDNSPGLSKEEQIEEDLLKIRVIQSRVNRNRSLVAKEKVEDKMAMLTDKDREKLAKRFEALLEKKEQREEEIQKKRKEAEEKKAPKRKRGPDSCASTAAPSEASEADPSEAGSSVVSSAEEAEDLSKKRRRWRMLPWLEEAAAPEVKEEPSEDQQDPEEETPAAEPQVEEEEAPVELTGEEKVLKEHREEMQKMKQEVAEFVEKVLKPATQTAKEAADKVKIAPRAEKKLAKERADILRQERQAALDRESELNLQIKEKGKEFCRRQGRDFCLRHGFLYPC